MQDCFIFYILKVRNYWKELKYGAPTWYEWTNKHWETKWNVYG